jgi:hypothetical protein
MKVKISRAKKKWQKHTYINDTQWEINLIDSEDGISHLTVISPHSTISAQYDHLYSNKPAPKNSRVVIITQKDVIVDDRGYRWVYSPDE